MAATKPLGLVVTNALTANWWLYLSFPIFQLKIGKDRLAHFIEVNESSSIN